MDESGLGGSNRDVIQQAYDHIERTRQGMYHEQRALYVNEMVVGGMDHSSLWHFLKIVVNRSFTNGATAYVILVLHQGLQWLKPVL